MGPWFKRYQDNGHGELPDEIKSLQTTKPRLAPGLRMFHQMSVSGTRQHGVRDATSVRNGAPGDASGDVHANDYDHANGYGRANGDAS